MVQGQQLLDMTDTELALTICVGPRRQLFTALGIGGFKGWADFQCKGAGKRACSRDPASGSSADGPQNSD